MTTISLKDTQARLAETVERKEAGPVALEDSKVYDRVFGPFDRGEFRELTDQDWQDLVDGKRKSLHDPQSFALPPKGQGG